MPTGDPIEVYDARWETAELDDAAVRRLFEATFIYGLEPGVEPQPEWCSGYLRIATNEKSVVRSYFTAARADELLRIESRARDLYTRNFGGKVID